MNKIIRGYIIVFVLALTLPYPLYLFAAKYLDLENHENHELVTMEQVLCSSWDEKTAVLENFINDHLPYKNELTNLNTRLDMHVFQSLDSQDVLLGKENWLFYKKDSCIDDYCKRLAVTEEEIQATLTSMQKLKSYLDKHEVGLVYLITPNKETIYGEYYMPDYVHVTGKNSRADELFWNIQNNTDINIIFPKKELWEARDNGYQVYKKYDTHWNMLGGYIGAMSLLKALGMQTQEIDVQHVTDNGRIAGDLAYMIAMGNVFCDDIDYIIDTYKEDISVELIEEREEPNLNYSHYRADCKNGQTIMCIGDSFLRMTEAYIAKNFAESYFMHISNYTENAIEDAKPDVIVITSTERGFPGLHWSLDAMMEKMQIS